MKTIITLILMTSVFSLFIATESSAQRGMGRRGSGGWGPGASYCRMYNTNTVETISGVVTSVDKITPTKGMYYGVHLMLKTDKETVSVHLGPGWYIENQDIMIEPNDKVEITGSRITFDGNPALIAAVVKRGDDVLVLRDENGFPAWSGWRRRQFN